MMHTPKARVSTTSTTLRSRCVDPINHPNDSGTGTVGTDTRPTPSGSELPRNDVVVR